MRGDDFLDIDLGIFLKEPRAGEVKTRLVGERTADEVTKLYTAFVHDTLTLALNAPVRQCILHHAGAPPSTWFEDPSRSAWTEAVRAGRGREAAQCDGDLGARLAAAFAQAERPMLVLGTDSPDLPADLVLRGLRALDAGYEAVFGGVGDGGVWCIGLRDAPAAFFDGLPWSAAFTGEALRNRADALGLKRAELPGWFDCDTPDDLGRLVDRLQRGRSRANMTRLELAALGLLASPEPPTTT